MYKDINVGFSLNNQPGCVENMSSIKQSLERLLSTRIGSVPFNRGYGSSVWNLLFENNNLDTYQIELMIYQDITQWEPRVSIAPGGITVSTIDEHSFMVDLQFTVPSLSNAEGSISQTITVQ